MTARLAAGCVEALAVLADRESSLPDRHRAERHVERCPVCADVLDGDDVGERVLHALAQHRPVRGRTLDAVLIVAAALQVIVAGPWMFGENIIGFLSHHVAHEHLTRDGALGLLVGGAGLITAWRPRYARPMLLVGAVAVAAHLVAFAVDRSQGLVHSAFELSHLITVVVFIAIAARALMRPPAPAPRRV